MKFCCGNVVRMIFSSSPHHRDASFSFRVGSVVGADAAVRDCFLL